MQFESTLFVVMCWKRAPFLRIVPPLLAGIILQLYILLLPVLLWSLICIAVGGLLWFRFLPVQWRFVMAWVPGVLLNVLLGCCGALLLYNADTRHQKGFYGDVITDSSLLLLRINEPLQ
jgi:competence protein ComEC